jgi:hypothetical protein
MNEKIEAKKQEVETAKVNMERALIKHQLTVGMVEGMDGWDVGDFPDESFRKYADASAEFLRLVAELHTMERGG